MNFDDLLEGGAAAVQRLVDEHVEETHQLEFKSKREADKLELHKDDRRALGEALSGFANAAGGLVIVGIETDRPDGVDRATNLRPIESVAKVADRYRAYSNDCVNPVVSELRIAFIDIGEGAGVILIEVPKGNARPHMSMAPGHGRYYRRVGDTFAPMEHYEVEEMMRLKTAPNLRLILRFQSGGSIGGAPKHFLQFGLQNTSGVTAKYPFVSVQIAGAGPRVSEYGLDGNRNTLWPRIARGSADDILFAGGADDVIHPGQSLFVSRFEYMAWGESRLDYWMADTLPDEGTLALTFSFGCEDLPMRTAKVTLTKSDLLHGKIVTDQQPSEDFQFFDAI